MDPTATPPWRVLETPAADSAAQRSVSDSPQAPPTVTGLSSLVKAVAIGGAAVACAIAAFLLAADSGDSTVRVDGGSPLAVGGQLGPSSSGGIAIGTDVVVEIVGAIPRPGVYRLPADARVGDLVRLAGGFGPRVDTARAEQELNLAAPLRDGDHIRVPSRDDIAPQGPSGETGVTASAAGGLVDLNRATQSELEALPGIGPVTAEKIIGAREETPFTSVEELRSRGLLGEKTFEKLRDLVTVE